MWSHGLQQQGQRQGHTSSRLHTTFYLLSKNYKSEAKLDLYISIYKYVLINKYIMDMIYVTKSQRL